MARSDPQPPTADRLRHDIDRGLTGDKVAGSDPAAAPLGTDDEAGGTPPSQREIELEAEGRTMPPPERSRLPGWLWLAGLVVVVLLILAALQAG